MESNARMTGEQSEQSERWCEIKAAIQIAIPSSDRSAVSRLSDLAHGSGRARLARIIGRIQTCVKRRLAFTPDSI